MATYQNGEPQHKTRLTTTAEPYLATASPVRTDARIRANEVCDKNAVYEPKPFEMTTPFWQVNKNETGLEHWNNQRHRWATVPSSSTALAVGSIDASAEEKLRQRRAEGKIWKTAAHTRPSKHNLERIYTLCIGHRKPFTRAVNLAELVPVLIAGWQKDGTWPEGQSAPPDSPPP